MSEESAVETKPKRKWVRRIPKHSLWPFKKDPSALIEMPTEAFDAWTDDLMAKHKALVNFRNEIRTKE